MFSDPSAVHDQDLRNESTQAPYELSLQRAADDPGPGRPAVSLQPAPPPDAAPAPANPPGQPAATTSSSSGSSSSTGDQVGSTNLDELASRLFDPLSNRIKAELRLDRERAGLITDARP